MRTVELPHQVILEGILGSFLVFKQVTVICALVTGSGAGSARIIVNALPTGVDGEFVWETLLGADFGKPALVDTGLGGIFAIGRIV